MTFCGLWPTRHALTAVVVDESGKPEPSISLSLSETHHPADWEELFWDVLSQLKASVGLDVELVLPAAIARAHWLVPIALERGFHVSLVPDNLVQAIRIVTRLNHPSRVAAAIARLPLAPLLRQKLQRIAAHEDF